MKEKRKKTRKKRKRFRQGGETRQQHTHKRRNLWTHVDNEVLHREGRIRPVNKRCPKLIDILKQDIRDIQLLRGLTDSHNSRFNSGLANFSCSHGRGLVGDLKKIRTSSLKKKKKERRKKEEKKKKEEKLSHLVSLQLDLLLLIARDDHCDELGAKLASWGVVGGRRVLLLVEGGEDDFGRRQEVGSNVTLVLSLPFACAVVGEVGVDHSNLRQKGKKRRKGKRKEEKRREKKRKEERLSFPKTTRKASNVILVSPS